MAEDPGPDVVAGEKRVDLLLALSYFRKTESVTGGRMSFEFDMPGDAAVPLVRALMRVEAELLLRGADLVDVGVEARTPEQRRVSAFVALVDLLAGEGL